MFRRWLNNLSITEKVLLAPLLLLSALAVLCFVGWSIVTNQAVMYRSGMIQHQAMSGQFRELPEVLLDAQTHLYKLTIWQSVGVTGDELESVKTRIRQRLDEIEHRVEQLALEHLIAGGSDGLEQDVSNLLAASRSYVRAAEQALLLIERNPIVGATAARGAERSYARAAQVSRALAEAEALALDRDLQLFEQRSNGLAVTFVVIAGLLACAVIVFAILSARTIAVPIRQLAGVFNQLAAGKRSIDSPCEARRDEVGEIAAAVTGFRDSLERNDQLVSQLAEFHDRVSRECLLASQMQRALLPQDDEVTRVTDGSDLAISSLYRASSELSGDLWGCRRIGPDQVGVYLVDFTGHGMAASLHTAQFHAMLHNVELDWSDPVNFLQEVNRRLCGTLAAGTFATLLYGVCDLSARTFRYASAGAPRPVFGQNGRRESVRPLESAGLPVGVTEAVHYEERAVALQPGSFLLLYSDALIETPSPAAPHYDLSGLIERVAAETERHQVSGLVTALSRDLLAFADGPLEDDLTMVCLGFALDEAVPARDHQVAVAG